MFCIFFHYFYNSSPPAVRSGLPAPATCPRLAGQPPPPPAGATVHSLYIPPCSRSSGSMERQKPAPQTAAACKYKTFSCISAKKVI